MTSPPADQIELMFGGMEKLAPGSDDDTLLVLRSLQRRTFSVVVDAGCGSGRQTLVLASELGVPVDAVDLHEPFLRHLARRASGRGLGALVRTHCMDMKDIPSAFPRIDLLWAEGSAYSIGFTNALASWAPAIAPGGFLVASELCWLSDNPPPGVREFFATEYPDMRSVDQTAGAARAAGYRILRTHALAPETWVDGYYDILESRAGALVRHEHPVIREFAGRMEKEIDVFRRSEGSYGYVFFVLQRT